MKANCGNCRFVVAGTHWHCRRLPPYVVKETGESAFPLVAPVWAACGEYRRNTKRILAQLVEWLRGLVVHERQREPAFVPSMPVIA